MVDSTAAHLKANPVAYMGPWFLGLLTLTFMLAVLTIQAMNYFSTFGFESLWLFTLVVSCILLSIGEWLTIVSALWDWCVQNYGDWRRLAVVPWQMVALPLTMWLIVFTSQLFFASRCYTLYGRSKLVFGTLFLGMIAGLGLYVGFAAALVINPWNGQMLMKTSLSGLAVNVATDVAITGLTLWKLGCGSKTYSPQTQRGLERLRDLTAEAAVPPTISMIVNIALFLGMNKQNHISVWFGMITPALYVWSMMFTLNSRIAIRQTFNSPNYEEGETLSAGFQFANLEAGNGNRGQGDIKKGATTLAPISETPLVAKRSIGIPLERVGHRVNPGITRSSGATLNDGVF